MARSKKKPKVRAEILVRYPRGGEFLVSVPLDKVLQWLEHDEKGRPVKEDLIGRITDVVLDKIQIKVQNLKNLQKALTRKN